MQQAIIVAACRIVYVCTMSIRLLVKLVQILLEAGVTCFGASHSPIGKVADCPINWRVSLCIVTGCKNDFTPPTTPSCAKYLGTDKIKNHLYPFDLFPRSQRLLTAARINSYSRVSSSAIDYIFCNRLNKYSNKHLSETLKNNSSWFLLTIRYQFNITASRHKGEICKRNSYTSVVNDIFSR